MIDREMEATNKGPGLRTPDALRTMTVSTSPGRSKVIENALAANALLTLYTGPARNRLHHAYWFHVRASIKLDLMTKSTFTGSTKKTLQELSKVLNRLAYEFNTELKRARTEIENLRREVNKLGSFTGSRSNPKPSTKTNKKTAGSKRGNRNALGKTGNSNSGGSQSAHEKKKESSPAIPQSDSEYIFPREPFNPPSPPEPSPPNN